MTDIPKIVIVGGGAGGLELATKLGSALGRRRRADITLVDKSPTHIWKPLLHQVAAGTLNAYHDEQNYFIHAARHYYEFQLGALASLNRKSRYIKLAPVLGEGGAVVVPEREIHYDYLVIAIGSTCNDFGTPGANEFCIYLDSRVKADNFHRKFLEQYIAAHSTSQRESPGLHLPIIIIGGGATGVELAAELHHAAKQYVKFGLDEIEAKNVNITLIEAGSRILAALPEKIALEAEKGLRKIGVTVLTGEKVTAIGPEDVKTESGKSISSVLKIWCAGIKASEMLREMDGLEVNKLNQLLVTSTLHCTLDDSIFAFGDCAMCPQGDKAVPPRAQAAHQQASALAQNIIRKLDGKALKPFVYNDRGSLVSLSKEDSLGVLMGRLTGSVNIHGILAKLIYISLYRSHQFTIHGLYKTITLIISDLLGRSTGQRTKLH